MKVAVHQQGNFLRNDEFLLPDAALPQVSKMQSVCVAPLLAACSHGRVCWTQMAMLNAARKARVQRYLDASPSLLQAADESKRYTESTEKQPQHSDPLMHGLIRAVAQDRFPDLGEPDMFSEYTRVRARTHTRTHTHTHTHTLCVCVCEGFSRVDCLQCVVCTPTTSTKWSPEPTSSYSTHCVSLPCHSSYIPLKQTASIRRVYNMYTLYTIHLK